MTGRQHRLEHAHVPMAPPAASRRTFLKGLAGAAAGLAAAGCGATWLPTVMNGSGTPTPAMPKVAIAQATGYDRSLIQARTREMLDSLGGLRDVIRAGDKVAIKTNLTGGLYFQPRPGSTAIESYLTHPEVVRAVGELLRDAGAREIFIVEAVYDKQSYDVFGYEDVARDLGATLVDLNRPDPYGDFAITPVGANPFVYEKFTFNHTLEDVDAFISVAKMKCHANAGVTHSMKNLVGLVPAAMYALSPDHWWRSALHGADSGRARLPRVIVDLNRARPIQLAVIDGVMTGEAGEVPRDNNSFKPVQPGVLLAGKNAVSTDAVATAVMGFDPTADYPNPPFLRGDNHLNLAHSVGLGTNRLEEIQVVGPAIQDVRYPFRPA